MCSVTVGEVGAPTSHPVGRVAKGASTGETARKSIQSCALARSVPGKTIVLTGAMIPYAFGSSDGLFNLGSALSLVQVLKPGIYNAMRNYEEWFVTSLIVDDGQCRGCVAMDIRTGELHAIAAKTTIICTGGLGRVYEPSTNALICTGVVTVFAGGPEGKSVLGYHAATGELAWSAGEILFQSASLS